MVFRLGLDGYAFAKVDPVPQLDHENHKVNLTLLVEPGNRVYVRRINVSGATSINDDVLRREFRQLEGAYLSNAALDRSKELLQRIPFIEKAEADTKPVPGTSDLVDVEFKIKEGLPGTFSAGIGYSGSQSFILNGSFTHSNFMGTGNRVAAEVQAGRYAKIYSFSHTDPYTTVDGVSRTVGLSYRDSSQFSSAASEFETRQGTASLMYGYPITDRQRLNFGVSATFADLATSTGSAPEAIDWVRNNGKPYVLESFYGTPPQSFFDFGTKFTAYEANAGWLFDSRDRTLFARAGTRVRVNAGYTLPGSQVDFLTLTADYLKFIPLWRNFTLMINADASYSQALGDTTSVPQFRRSLAGGPDSVRGYRESRLGPKDRYGRPYGGNLRTVLQTEILFPMPEKWANSARVSLFYDIGNVFSTDDIQFYGTDGFTPVDYSFSYDKLKHSTGIAVQWLAPLGVFRFSYALPLNAKQAEGAYYADEKEGFQFSIGQAF
jgi:outer membrane protein insertion porin family